MILAPRSGVIRMARAWPQVHPGLGATLCRCGHAQADHHLGREDCRAPRARRYGCGCPCLRFTEAPFEAQQYPLELGLMS